VHESAAARTDATEKTFSAAAVDGRTAPDLRAVLAEMLKSPPPAVPSSSSSLKLSMALFLRMAALAAVAFVCLSPMCHPQDPMAHTYKVEKRP
jgi:hypothetical protein